MTLIIHIASLLVLAVGASGCIQEARLRDAFAAGNAAKEACRAQVFPNNVEKAKCHNDAERVVGSTYPYPDLLNLRIAARTSLAEKVDRKLLTEAEAELEFAKVSAGIGAQEAARSASSQIASAQSEMAAAHRSEAISRAIDRMTPAPQPVIVQQPQRVPLNCRTVQVRGQFQTDCQ